MLEETLGLTVAAGHAVTVGGAGLIVGSAETIGLIETLESGVTVGNAEKRSDSRLQWDFSGTGCH